MQHLYHFSPINDGELLPGLSNSIVPTQGIKNIAKSVLDDLIKKYHIDRAKLSILIGNDAEAFEGFEIIKSNYDVEYATTLNNRRGELYQT
jgi:hypothetical protein